MRKLYVTVLLLSCSFLTQEASSGWHHPDNGVINFSLWECVVKSEADENLFFVGTGFNEQGAQSQAFGKCQAAEETCTLSYCRYGPLVD